MPPILTTILVVVPLTILTAWWNIQIRFASDKNDAMKMWKKNAATIAIVLLFVLQTWVFVSQIFSTEPLTRKAVGQMIISGSLLIILLMVWFVSNIIDVSDKQWDVTKTGFKGIADMVEILDKRITSLSNLVVSKQLSDLGIPPKKD